MVLRSRPRLALMQVGTAVVTRGKDHRLALGRLGALVEQLEALVRSGRQVILVTSGGVGVGRQKLMQQRVLNSSPLELQMAVEGAPGMASTVKSPDGFLQTPRLVCPRFAEGNADVVGQYRAIF